MQYDINRESAKISALSSGKIDKYEYLTGEEILPFNQRQIREQAKFAYSPLEKAFEKQTERQIDPKKSLDISNKKDESKQTESIFPQNLEKEIVRLQDIIKKDNLNYKSNCEKTFNFSKYLYYLLFF